eukprot:gnl/MRDRNA2_/MRDRNA2_216666_c0_seq1.p1 gnl/MRDRNA2_/MRDRNA2_216666_c0~~gnl/MRDRNA2_/MRDRNA2_216666_c0_seq1.p1  ORF type:complete len:185 (-),score=36.55 gnl/MRDRNA2_/MRDRNA2_216666_c0_seq1:11-565(-)
MVYLICVAVLLQGSLARNSVNGLLSNVKQGHFITHRGGPGKACSPGGKIEEAPCYADMKGKGEVFVCDPSADGYYHGGPTEYKPATAGTGGCHTYVFLDKKPEGCEPGSKCEACKTASGPCSSHLWADESNPSDGAACSWIKDACTAGGGSEAQGGSEETGGKSSAQHLTPFAVSGMALMVCII